MDERYQSYNLETLKVLATDGPYQTAGQAFYRTSGVARQDTEGRFIYDPGTASGTSGVHIFTAPKHACGYFDKLSLS